MYISKQQHNEQVLKIRGYKQVPTTTFWVHPFRDCVWDVHDGILTPLPLRLTLGGYLHIEAPEHCTLRYPRFHLLRAAAFIPLGKYAEVIGEYQSIWEFAKKGVVVNHKDGIKINNAIDNLEWVTHSENSIHAFKTGLRTDSVGIYMYDVMTKKETYYYAVIEASKKYKINDRAFHKYLSSDRDTLFAFRFLIRKATENDYPVWVSHHDAWKSTFGVSGLSAVKVIDKTSGKVSVFYTRKLATTHYSLSYLFNKKFTHKDDFIEDGKYKMLPVTDCDELTQLAREYKSLNNFYNGGKSGQRKLPFKVTDSEGNETIYENIIIAAKALGTTVEGLKTGVNKTKGKGKWKGYQIEIVK